MKYKTICALSVFAVNSESAVITLYDNEAAWNTATGLASIESFDSGAASGSFSATGGTVDVDFNLTVVAHVSSASFNGADFRNGTTGAGVRIRGNQTATNAVDTLTFSMTDANVTANAFAIDIHDMFDTVNTSSYAFKIEFQTVGGTFQTVFDTGTVAGLGGNLSGPVSYTAGTGTGASTGSLVFGQDGTTGVGDGVFLGFTSTDAIQTVRLTKDTFVGGGDNWSIDDLKIVAESVPEPSSAALLGLGAIGLLARRKRQA